MPDVGSADPFQYPTPSYLTALANLPMEQGAAGSGGLQSTSSSAMHPEGKQHLLNESIPSSSKPEAGTAHSADPLSGFTPQLLHSFKAESSR